MFDPKTCDPLIIQPTRLEQYLEIENHQWTDAFERHRKDLDQKERQIDLALHHERREGSNRLENREMRMSDIVLEHTRTIIADRIEIRKRLALECPELLSDSELSNLEESMLCSVQAARSTRRDDYERRACAAGVPTHRQTQRDLAAYGGLEALVRREIRKLQLDRSLGRTAAPKSEIKDSRAAEPATQSRQPRLTVFLCHSSGDKPAVRELYQRLKADGVSPWFDEEDILPGQDWEREIRNAIRASNIVVVCLSSASITKEGYVQKEIKLVLDAAEERPEGTIFVIPAKLEECAVPERLGRWQWLDLFNTSGYGRLLAAFRERATRLE